MVGKHRYRSVLLLSCLVYLIPFFVFSWWNHPAGDDFIIGVRRQETGFWPLQAEFYQGWSGRYFATLLSSLASYSGFLYDHYYSIAAIFLAATFCAWLFLLSQVNKYLLSNLLAPATRIVFSLLLLILEINVIPEVNTAFYWFSSAVTYQSPLILFLFVAGIWVRLLVARIYRFADAALLFVLTVCIHGCNEIFSICFLLLSTVFATAWYLFKKPNRSLVLGWWVWSVVCAGFLFLAPGILNRSGLMPSGSVPLMVVLSLVKFALLNWYFLKEPLWWALAAATFIAARQQASRRPGRLPIILQKTSAWKLALLYLLMGVLNYLPVLITTNGSLPLRAENMLCFQYSLFSLGGVYLITFNYAVAKPLIHLETFATRYGYALLAILIFCTPNMQLVVRTLASGYFYHEVMLDRKAALTRAGRQGPSVVILDNYEISIDKKIHKLLPGQGRATLDTLLRQKPPLIFFEDNLANKTLVQRFYGIDTLILRSR